MALVAFQQATAISLENMLNKTAPQTLVLKLFKNNHVPVITDTEAAFTEATFTGYSAKTLTAASWTVTAGSPSIASFAAQTFTSTADQAAQLVYGYYVVQTSSGKAMWAEYFQDLGGNSTPQVVQFNNDAIVITPRYQRS